ncbi:MAG TPA: hypothetical protein VGH38_33640 [Bryobacteraceae bacterium]|jgi:hypothetical protein
MKRDAVLWLVLLAGPAIWLMSFGANFALAPWACTLRWKPALYGISAVALALTAGSAWVAWSQWQQLGGEYPGEAGGGVSSSRALASGALLLNGLFFLVIFAQAIVELILGACE